MCYNSQFRYFMWNLYVTFFLLRSAWHLCWKMISRLRKDRRVCDMTLKAYQMYCWEWDGDSLQACSFAVLWVNTYIICFWNVLAVIMAWCNPLLMSVEYWYTQGCLVMFGDTVIYHWVMFSTRLWVDRVEILLAHRQKLHNFPVIFYSHNIWNKHVYITNVPCHFSYPSFCAFYHCLRLLYFL